MSRATPPMAAHAKSHADMAMPRYPRRRLEHLLAFRTGNPWLFASLIEATQGEIEQYATDREAALVIDSGRVLHHG